MTSYFRRYLRGERGEVWDDLRALGPVPDDLAEDVAAVADETMLRVGQHVARIAAALPELGWTCSDRQVDPHLPPTDGDRAMAESLAEKVGGLPYALEACFRRVGHVWFAGDCEALLLTYHQEPAPHGEPPSPEYPDPLCLGNAYALHSEWQDYGHEPEFAFALAPDEYHKANTSGATHDIALPSSVADPVLAGVAGRPGITLVEYLRESVRWGGFPGYSFAPDLAPAALITLRCDPDF
ncbi:hypothetical protein V5P93_001707 [Actinokineospora auranticolor]|uniref:hypothetical protein n=1 Tax=Actinokineospora auranticolor TaxID=155976 RepID=UPI000CEC1DBD|nr:hypothetical protein [Actinokineospora auranticolor]